MTANPTPVSSRATTAVFALLAAHGGVEGRVTGLPVARIAEQTGYATRTVERALAALRAEGRIEGGQAAVGTVGEYTIVDEELREVA